MGRFGSDNHEDDRESIAYLVVGEDNEENRHHGLPDHEGDEKIGNDGDIEDVGSQPICVTSSASSPLLGCLGLHPSCLQPLGRAAWFLVFLCGFCMFQAMTQSGLIPVVISSIERRYGLSSKETGTLISFYDATTGIAVVLITHYGHRAHRPLWLARCMVLFAVGCFIFIIPQAIGRKYIPLGGVSGDETCPIASGVESEDCSSNEKYLFSFFIVAQFFMAIGAAPIYTLGVTFLDDNVAPEKGSVYVGIFYMFSCLGPAIGFILGGAFLSIWIDPGASSSLTPASSGWVGAWWAGFVFSGGMLLLLSPFMAMYPRHLPGTHWIRKVRGATNDTNENVYVEEAKVGSALVVEENEQRQTYQSFSSTSISRASSSSEANTLSSSSSPSHHSQNFSSQPSLSVARSSPSPSSDMLSPMNTPLFLNIKKLLLNRPYLFLQLGSACEALVVVGIGAFLPKVVQTQFLFSASQASFVSGACVIIGASSGTVIGGILSKRWTPLQNARAVAYFSLLALCCSTTVLLHCSSVVLVGVTNPYPFPNNSSIQCNALCNCSNLVYKPVCTPSGSTYRSACHAGCASTLPSSSFTNCSCLPSPSDLVSDGVCRDGCGLLPVFLVLLLFLMLFTFMNQVPITVVTLRCVSEQERSLALGIGSFLYRVVGAIPGPLIVGAVLDKSCLLWETKVCA